MTRTTRPTTDFRGRYRFLSNYSPHPATYKGRTYRTAEHAFAAAKTLDDTEQARIAAAPAPGDAKRLGRRFRLQPDWDEMRVEVMTAIVTDKFTRDPELADALLATGEAELVEHNDWGDDFWGRVRKSGSDGPVWTGENHLGRTLMDVRARLRERRCG